MTEATDAAFAGKWVVNDRPRVDYVRLAIRQQEDRYYKQFETAKDERPAHIWYVKGREEG
jgi:hypothetical protein